MKRWPFILQLFMKRLYLAGIICGGFYLHPNFKRICLIPGAGHIYIEHVQFSKQRSWVRHDEHYHVDFSIPCQ